MENSLENQLKTQSILLILLFVAPFLYFFLRGAVMNFLSSSSSSSSSSSTNAPTSSSSSSSISQAQLREKIKSIKEDTSLSEKEKTERIQAIMTNGKASSDEQQPNMSVTCSHYPVKKCSKFKFSCCGGLIDPCKRCHMERGCKNPVIAKITCTECQTEQDPSASCINESCKIVFCTSHCPTCQLWTAATIFHCEDCGICRVGRAEDHFHCFVCEGCFPLASQAEHKCAKSSLRDEKCAVCLESLHTSQHNASILPCGHALHSNCMDHNQFLQFSRCPICLKSSLSKSQLKHVWRTIRGMIALQPMPPDFFYSNIDYDDVVDSPQGPFKVQDFILSGQLCERVDGSVPLYRKALIPVYDQVEVQGTLLSSQGDGDGDADDNTAGNEQKVTLTFPLTSLRKNADVLALCNDCGTTAKTPFHFLGLECSNCGGFNTTQTRA